jgi:hypothetical protein
MPKFNPLGWLICQFKKHKLVCGWYENGRWVPLHCRRCGLVFGK